MFRPYTTKADFNIFSLRTYLFATKTLNLAPWFSHTFFVTSKFVFHHRRYYSETLGYQGCYRVHLR